jgi:pyruvate dehydrogenase E1 component
VIASTDYMKAYAEQIRPFMPKGRTYKVLGTDGFGRSDFRASCASTSKSTATTSSWPRSRRWPTKARCPRKVAEAIAKYGIKTDKINPLYA